MKHNVKVNGYVVYTLKSTNKLLIMQLSRYIYFYFSLIGLCSWLLLVKYKKSAVIPESVVHSPLTLYNKLSSKVCLERGRGGWFKEGSGVG